MTDTSHSHDAGHGHDTHHADHGGMGKYIAVFLALCVLTTMSFFTYSSYWPFKETPAVGWTFMMAVSCCKASLVILFFMHLKYEADWKYVLTIPASIMSIFLALALVPDIGLRMKRYSSERKDYLGTPAIVMQLERESAEQAKHHSEKDSHSGKAPGGH
jgi:cytochrome c oxidase subunit 4